MSTHPSLEDLFAAAAAPRPSESVATHLAGCPSCTVSFSRLREGARMMDLARAAPVAVDWDAVDAVVLAEADRVAAGIRTGTVRVLRPWGRMAAAGLSLAAAAAAVFFVRYGDPIPARNLGTVAAHAAVHRDVQTPEAPAWEGSVLLSAGGATWQDTGGSSGLASIPTVREGGTIHTGPHGRGVVTVQPGWTLDVRPDSHVSLPRLREGAVTVALAEGSVALAPGAGAVPSVPVDLRAGHWTVAAAGALTAQVQTGVVRVVVLGSSVSVRRDDASAVQYAGPIVLELPDVGVAVPAAGVPARDPDALDLATVSVAGRLWLLPSVDPSASISAVGHGSLPAGLDAIRVEGPLTLRARGPHGTQSLDVGTGHPVEWQRSSSAVASANPGVAHTTSPTVTQQPEVSHQAMEAISARAGSFVQHCINTCRDRGRCQTPIHGTVGLNLDAGGRVASIDVPAAVSDPEAQRCIQNQRAFITAFPGGHSRVEIAIH